MLSFQKKFMIFYHLNVIIIVWEGRPQLYEFFADPAGNINERFRNTIGTRATVTGVQIMPSAETTVRAECNDFEIAGREWVVTDTEGTVLEIEGRGLRQNRFRGTKAVDNRRRVYGSPRLPGAQDVRNASAPKSVLFKSVLQPWSPEIV